ncbi:Flavoprotein, putative [Plasmodium yoelii yoelii]|uniref:Flavoprotein, putative n=1 Tax=Plasmodium yoelii yoelii TaxID=73239 RepID=Q7RRZ6_PLAYO|nr:Flavoprotein, putative [Plasmodium yoelii yoelii]
MKLLLGITGSIAAIKTGEIVEKLKKECENKNIPIEIKYVATNVAFEKFLNNFKEKVLLDKDEWLWKDRGDDILHIELRKWADLFVICPLDANTLAYISNGACPNLIVNTSNFFIFTKWNHFTYYSVNISIFSHLFQTSICRCWNFKKKILVFPCMNTYMFNHPITKHQLDIILSWGIKV